MAFDQRTLHCEKRSANANRFRLQESAKANRRRMTRSRCRNDLAQFVRHAGTFYESVDALGQFSMRSVARRQCKWSNGDVIARTVGTINRQCPVPQNPALRSALPTLRFLDVHDNLIWRAHWA